MKKYFSREVIIGIVSVISLLILFFGINYLKGVNLFKPTNHYYVKFTNVIELQNTSPIYVDGFKVGVVNEINYNYNRPKDIVVQISLNKSMRIQTGSYVELTSSLTTGASLHIILNTYVTTFCQIGDTIEGRLRTGPMETLTNTVLPQIENIMPKIDSLLTGLQNIMNHPALSQSLLNIQRTTANLESSAIGLNKMISNDIPVILDNFKVISEDFTKVSSGLQSLNFAVTYNNLNATLNNMEELSKQLHNKDSNVGLLLNDRTLYDNLNAAIDSMSMLVSDVKKHPKRYIRFSVF